MFFQKLNFIYTSLSKKNKSLFFLTIFLTIFSSFIDLLSIISIFPFLSLILDLTLLETNNYLNSLFLKVGVDEKTFVIIFGISIIILILVNVVFRFLSKLSIEYFSRHVIYETSTKLYAFYLHQSQKFYLKNNKGLLTQKCTDYIESLISGVLSPFIQILYLATTSTLIITALVIINLKISLYLILLLILYYLLFFKKISKKVQKAGGEYENFQDEFAKTMLDSFNIIKQTQILIKQNFFLNKYSRLAKNYRDSYITSYLFGTLPIYLIEFVVFVIIISISLVLFFYSGEYKTIIPLLIFFLTSLRRLVPSMQEIYYQLLQIKFHEKMNLKILTDLGEMTKYFKKKKTKINTKLNFNQNIKFENVKYSYGHSNKKFSFDVNIKKGDFIGIAGKSGNGKSTFLNILCGFLEPSNGKIKVDNVTVNSANLHMWQSKLGYVPQEVSLINESLKENIFLDKKFNKKNNRYLDFLRKILNLNFSTKANFNKEINKKVGAKGFSLSGGQKQRISIARSLSKRPEIIIFDEATNSLDLESENKIIQNIKKNFKEATIIICTHRLQTLKKCKNILFFKDNKIKRICSFNNMLRLEKDFLNSLENKFD